MTAKTENKFLKSFESFKNSSDKLSSDATDYIKEALLEETDNTIEFDEEAPTIVYDGGRHPEYASNSFSVVNYVSINSTDSKMYVDTEDACVPFDYLSASEKADIAFAVQNYLLRKH